MASNVFLVSVFCLSFVLFLVMVGTTTGRFVLEKIFGMKSEAKNTYKKVQLALSQNQYSLINTQWIENRVSYDIIVKIPNAELHLNSLFCETLSIKTSAGKFESCPELSSSHLIMTIRKLAKQKQLDLDHKEENQKNNRINQAIKLIGNQ